MRLIYLVGKSDSVEVDAERLLIEADGKSITVQAETFHDFKTLEPYTTFYIVAHGVEVRIREGRVTVSNVATVEPAGPFVLTAPRR